MRRTVLFGFLIGLFTSEGADPDISSLSEPIKQQIFNIYTGVALIDKSVQGDNVTADNIKYYLWATNQAQNYTIVNSTTPNSAIKSDALYVLFIHGWIETRDTEWYGVLRKAFFEYNPDYYIIEVDWSVYAFKDYIASSHDVKPVGGFIGEFIIYLHKNYSVPLDNILVVGHSLGGQVSGFVGKKVQAVQNEKLPRIVGLDAAGPLFETRPKNERLNSTDAKVVHAIHTNGGIFGFLQVYGTIDFFPNNGSLQPGCAQEILLSPADVKANVFCSHWRSWRFFGEAVPAPDKFKARKCDSWLQFTINSCKDDYETMGNLKTTKTEKYYLNTNSQSPYSK